MRAVFAKLADPAHILPMPGTVGLFFPAGGRLVDADDAFWHALLGDGSLIAAEEVGTASPESPDHIV
ncbi:hypothetical protein EYW49_20575 [Siculibacillus lacustris]|uniref:Uncharacterized protein n=1 Tax=Siculibacillus lacustris TaxID=1549641 RepID=A0A4V2KSL4_9HYPH|nr:hypothetical protein [Siculibacillus lacustris]TBW33357.1 hypothetical protein EYW49_20575 [Siculibacillus lacustris]